MAYYGRHPNNYTNCKLSASDVQTIRLWYDAGYKSAKEIGKEFNIHPIHVGRIGRRDSQTHVAYQDDYDKLVLEYRLKAKRENKMRNVKPNSKLSEADVAEIRSETELSNVEMGKKYKVDPNTIRRIRKGESRGGKDVDSPQEILTMQERAAESKKRYLEVYGIFNDKGELIGIRNETLETKKELSFAEMIALSKKKNPMDNADAQDYPESFKLPEIE